MEVDQKVRKRLTDAVEADVKKPENAVVEAALEDAKELINQEEDSGKAKPEEHKVESA